MNKYLWLIVVLVGLLACSTGAYCEGLKSNIGTNSALDAKGLKTVVDDGCFENDECDPASYCVKNRGLCQERGECQKKPGVCIDVYEPVCGCDNRTYSNECVAASNGVSVVSDGPCPSSELELNQEFTLNIQETKKNINEQIGIKFIMVLDDNPCPVEAECTLQQNAEAIFTFYKEEVDGDELQHEGNKSRSFILNMDGAGPISVSVFGYTIELVNLIPPAPASIDNPDEHKDYVASLIVTKEDATCTEDSACGYDSYCKKQVGDCDGKGTCHPLPRPGDSVCIDEAWNPVCGCDGETYNNSCEAEVIGVNIANMGECQNSKEDCVPSCVPVPDTADAND
jgi:hypothetical protein